MRRSPSIVPDQTDREIYLVLDNFGARAGKAWRETHDEDTDRETLVRHLLAGEYSNPVQIVAFNTSEGWSRDVSSEIADELLQRCTDRGREIPPSVEELISRHGTVREVQLALPLRGAA